MDPAPFQGFFLSLPGRNRCQDPSVLDGQQDRAEGGVLHRNQLPDPPIPVESGCGQCQRLEQNFAFPDLSFPYKNEKELKQIRFQWLWGLGGSSWGFP